MVAITGGCSISRVFPREKWELAAWSAAAIPSPKLETLQQVLSDSRNY